MVKRKIEYQELFDEKASGISHGKVFNVFYFV